MQIDEHFLTLLTPDGQFLRARNEESAYLIGQEIQFIPMEAVEWKSRKWYHSVKMKTFVAAALIMIFGTGALIPFYQSNQVYAYMSLDDGSSIELEVNKDLEVIGIVPYNKQGEKIVESIGEWKKKDVSTISEKIVTEMKKQAFGDGEIVLCSTIMGEENKETDKAYKQKMSVIQTSAKNNNSTLVVVEGTENERNKAKNQGVTLGQIKENESVKTENQLKNTDSTSKPKQKKNEQTNTSVPNNEPDTESKVELKNPRANQNNQTVKNEDATQHSNKNTDSELNGNQNQSKYNQQHWKETQRQETSKKDTTTQSTTNNSNQNNNKTVNKDIQDRTPNK